MKKQQTNKLWGSAFTNQPDKQAVAFAAGRDVVGLPPADEALIPHEIQASAAYAKALFDVGLISEKEKTALVDALAVLQQEYTNGSIRLNPDSEDVQTTIEQWLIEKLGIEIAGKIHTGRSRNEQSGIESILHLKAANGLYIAEIKTLVGVLHTAAKKYAMTILPGYTHHQHATVTTFGNMLHAFAVEFEKDIAHFQSWHDLEEINPLGSAAGYGSTLPIDKQVINSYLKLRQTSTNEIAAITFRGDAEATFVFNVSMFLNHISSLAQTLILFSTKEFGFVTINEAYSTGSSIMPQKKNPDTLEVMKAKASMCHGHLMSLLSLTKAPFVGYNRDSQWIKYVVSDVIWESKLVPAMMAGVIKTLTVNAKTMGALTDKHLFAQSIMEGLVLEFHIPMRKAKIVLETAIKRVGPDGNVTRKVINQMLEAHGYSDRVDPKHYAMWTNPLLIVQKQMKKEIL